MPKRKRRTPPKEKLPEELPEERAPLEEEIPKVGLKEPTPPVAGDKEAQWASIETEMATIKNEFIAGRITLNDAIDRLVTALNGMKEAPGLGGLGPGPEMAFPPEPATPPEETSPAPVI